MQYDDCVVPGISWSLGACVFLSFYRIVIVLSLSLPIYRNSVGTVFLIVSFPNDNTFRYDIHHKGSYPPLFRLHSYYFLVHFSDCPCTASDQITPSTYKRESIVLCFQALEMVSIRHLLNLALPPWGREGHSFPSTWYIVPGMIQPRNTARTSSIPQYAKPKYCEL